MPVNAASRSIHLAEDLAKIHDVQFVVHSRLRGTDLASLGRHLDEHLGHMRALRERGVVPVIGPFFTEEGENTGDGFYVLKVDDIGEARRLAAEDPLHKAGVREFTVQPWLQRVA